MEFDMVDVAALKRDVQPSERELTDTELESVSGGSGGPWDGPSQLVKHSGWNSNTINNDIAILHVPGLTIP